MGPAMPDDPRQAQFRFFDSVTTLLITASSRRPLVIILDNLHWADPSSLSLLEFLAQELSASHLLVVGTYRDVGVSRGQSLFHTLGGLSRQRLFHRIPLRGLALDEVRDLIRRMTGVEPDNSLVSAIHEQTAGNPFFVREMVRLLAQEGMLTAESAGALEGRDFRLPEGIREAIGRRLSSLSDECRGLLAQASVVGREFALRLLATLSGIPEERALELAEEALSQGIIEELPHEVDRLRFTHALIQQTLAAEMSVARKARLHARIAGALETMYGDEAGEHASELAYHFSEAEGILGPAKGVKYARLAGERALSRYAYEDAIGHFKRALSLAGGGIGRTELAGMLHGLGRAEAAVLAHDDALNHLRQAFDLFMESGDTDRAVEVASVVYTGRRPLAGVAAMAKQALAAIPLDSVRAGWLLTVYGRHLGMATRDTQDGVRACEEALRIAERHGDKRLELRARAVLLNISYGHRTEEAIQRALKLTESVDSPWDKSILHIVAVGQGLYSGNLEQADRHAREALTSAKRLGDRERISTAWWVNVLVAQSRGEWSTVRDCCRQALTVWPHDCRVLFYLAMTECETGEFERAEACLKKLLDLGNRPETGAPSPEWAYAAAVAWMARATGRLDRIALAKEIIRRDRGSSWDRLDYWWLPGFVAALTGDAESAADCYQKLIRGPSPPRYFAPYLLGLLARTVGRLDDAAVHFQKSLDFCRAGSFRPTVVWAAYHYAETLLERGRPGDRELAQSLAQECIAIAAELGMKPLHQRALALLQRAEAPPARGARYPAGLTRREAEVLRLVAAGKTDREIADELVISISTVGHHVSNILGKTGSANRTEAAAFAVRHGLA
jgi:DNA-binding CsgD family transcriptional regulator